MVIPVYNTARFLTQAVESVLGQTYQNLEIILVDDGSTDASGEMCDSFSLADPRVVAVHQPNLGLSAARNTGLDVALGSFIMFLDSDDWLSLDCIEELRRAISHSGGQAALCGTERVATPEQSRGSARDSERMHYSSGDEFLREAILWDPPVHPVSACGKLFDRALLEGIRFPHGRFHEDVFTTHQILHRAERIAVTTKILHYYRQRPGSITHGTMSIRSAADKARAHIEKARDLLEYGLIENARLELQRGVAWHFRFVNVLRSSLFSDGTPALRMEASEQRWILKRWPDHSILGRRTRLALLTYAFAPTLVVRAYSVLLNRQAGRTHLIEGEGTHR